MAKNCRYTVPLKRKKIGLTNYKKRLKLLLARKPRLTIRRSLNRILMQIIEYHPEGDKVLVSANSKELIKFGWKMNCKNIPSAYLTGLILGQKAKLKNINDVVVDIGSNISVKGSKIYSALKGAIDGGINVPHSEDIFPSEERIKGEHISAYASKLKEDKEKYNKQFSKYIKENVDIGSASSQFDEVKTKILNSK